MLTKLLDDIVGSIAGKPAVDIVNLLYGKKNVNEFFLAKKLKMTINQTRNILYKLSDAGLVEFTRKKDKRKGWYTYFWTLNLGKVYELIEKTINRNLNTFRAQLKSRKEKRFYTCKTCNIDISEETALLHDFTCQECGEVYELNTGEKIIKDLEKEIVKLEKELIVVKEELGKIGVKKAKKIEREVKKVKKEKAKKREKAKKARKREKNRDEKKKASRKKKKQKKRKKTSKKKKKRK